MWSTAGAEICRVRARLPHGVSGGEQAAARHALAERLGQAELRPPGLPPSAILLVRRLANPTGRSLALRPGSAGRDRAWEQAAQAALLGIARRAVRPHDGRLPTAAEAVLFADEGELLACLALDLSSGAAGQCWWSRLLLPHLSPSSAGLLKRLLCERARYLPAALSHLLAWRQAARVVDALTDAQALTVLSAVGAAHDLPELAASLAPRRPAPASDGPASRPRDDPAVDRAHGGSPPAAPRPALAPWSAWPGAPTIPPNLAREKTCLLGLGWALHRAPARVRDSHFRAGLRTWWLGQEARGAPPSEGLAAPTPLNAGSVARATTPGEAPQPLPDAGAPRGMALAQPSVSDTRPARPLRGRRDGGPNEAPVTRSIAPPVAHDPVAVPRVALGATPPASHVPDQKDVPTPLPDGTVTTRLGGVLYLLNLLRYLDLPACFEPDWRLASAVGPWGVLELLGRALLVPTGETLAADPLWRVLAALDGRDAGRLPGRGYRGARRFRLPAAWPQQLADRGGGYRWAAAYGRLRLWDERGFLLVDAPCDGHPPAARAVGELRSYAQGAAAGLSRGGYRAAPLDPLAGPLLRGLNRALAGWLARALPFVRLRLQQALAPAATTFDAEAALLRHEGRLYVTSSHVDLVLPLDAVSLPVRLAGLDRDPGWLPACGRVVQFHFE